MSFAAPAFLLVALLAVPAGWLYVRSERRARRGRHAFAAALRLIATQRAADKRRSPAAIVLISDGTSVCGSDPLEVATRAKAAGVAIHAVALGTDRAGASPPDPATLAQIAARSGGRAFEAADAAALEQVYDRLGSQVATERRKQEISGSFAGGALALMALAAAASLRWFGRFV